MEFGSSYILAPTEAEDEASDSYEEFAKEDLEKSISQLDQQQTFREDEELDLDGGEHQVMLDILDTAGN